MDEKDLPEQQRRRLGEPGDKPEDEREEPGAEGGSASPSADVLPGQPADDSTPVGDSDQHSSG